MNIKTYLQGAITMFLLLIAYTVFAGNNQPVTPDATPESKALLDLLYSISGKHILTGQHNYPNTKDRNSQFAAEYIGRTPVIWSSDMGFAKDGDTDSYLARPDIVKEAIRQHKMGAIVTLCWHAVPPTADEPVTFRPMPGADPEKLESVQGQLTNEQFEEVLTPGTPLHEKWLAQVDTVAYYLKQLEEAHVPVLWRPYHEMNGNWFWWGARIEGEYTTKSLYKALFDRYVNYHKLKNLIWVWSVDRVHRPEMEFRHFYPGNEYLDVLALDVYGSDFAQHYYDGLMEISNGKPITLGEVGNPPTADILDKQPNWCWWVVWAGMTRNTSRNQYLKFIENERVLFQEDGVFLNIINTYRKNINLPEFSFGPDSYSGKWLLNEEESKPGQGMANLPYKMRIYQMGDELLIERSYVVEWDVDRIENQTYVVNGEPVESKFWNSPMISVIYWGEKGELKIESTVSFTRDGNIREMKSSEVWSLEDNGRNLKIEQISESSRGKMKNILQFKRELHIQ